MADVDERKRGAARLLLRDVYDCRQRLDRLGVLAYMVRDSPCVIEISLHQIPLL